MSASAAVVSAAVERVRSGKGAQSQVGSSGDSATAPHLVATDKEKRKLFVFGLEDLLEWAEQRRREDKPVILWGSGNERRMRGQRYFSYCE